MRTLLRTGLLAAVATATLAFAGSALAAITPKLVVVAPAAPGAGPAVSVTADLNQNDDAVAKVQLFAPLGYQLNAPQVGRKVGDATVRARLADRGNALVQAKGRITAVDPATFAAQSAQCDPVGHAAAWAIDVTIEGQKLRIPIFVDETSGSEAALAVYKLVVCLPPPDVPAGTPGRAPAGAKVVFAQFDLNAFANPPANGEYRWRSLWTPYVPGTAVLDTGSSVESQSVVRLPTQVTVNARRTKVRKNGKVRTLVTVTGRLSQAGTAYPAAKVSLQHGKTKSSLYRLKAVFTKRDGTYVKRLYITRPTWFMTEIAMPLRVLGSAGCRPSFGAGVPCVSAFIGGNRVLSQLVRVTPYRS